MNINEIITSDSFFANKEGLTHEPLNGGLSNETHIVTWNEEKYVVKINFSQSDYHSLTRITEMLAQSKAAALGIAPKVLSDSNQSEYSITEFITGHLMEHEEIVDKNNIKKIAEVLRQVHSIEGVERKSSVFDLIEGYMQGISKFDILLPEGLSDILNKTDKIRNRRSLDTRNNHKYCHNDILSNNLLFDGNKITVIDWELSGIGDPYMDLGSLPYSNNFHEEENTLLLKEYFGYYDEEMKLNLDDMRYVGMVREVVWALFYAGFNKKSVNHDFDYYGAANYALDRIKNGYLSMWGE